MTMMRPPSGVRRGRAPGAGGGGGPAGGGGGGTGANHDDGPRAAVGDGAGQRLAVGAVDLERVRAGLPREGEGCVLRYEIGEGDLGAVGCEPANDRGADAPAAAQHQDILAGKNGHQCACRWACPWPWSCASFAFSSAWKRPISPNNSMMPSSCWEPNSR